MDLNFNSSPEFKTLIGTSAEHLVCADLISKGFPAFLTSPGFPYNIICDKNGILYRIQVKATENPRRRSNYIRNNERPVYRFSAKRNYDYIDIMAFVALDTKEIVYMKNSECPTIIEFDNEQSFSNIDERLLKWNKGGCRQFKDYPPGKVITGEKEERPYYLATPYTKYPLGLEEAYQAASEMTMFLKENGVFVYCPIAQNNGPALYAPKEIKLSHDFWLTDDFKFVKISRGLIVCKMLGWSESFGIGEEIKLATKLGLPIIYTNFMEMPKFD